MLKRVPSPSASYFFSNLLLCFSRPDLPHSTQSEHRGRRLPRKNRAPAPADLRAHARRSSSRICRCTLLAFKAPMTVSQQLLCPTLPPPRALIPSLIG